jgi:hypothetical protein
MKIDITSFQAVASNLAIEGEVCDLASPKVSTQTETDTEIAALIEKVGAMSIAEVDRLMAELQDAKIYLLSEAERIERETVRYANLIDHLGRCLPMAPLTKPTKFQRFRSHGGFDRGQHRCVQEKSPPRSVRHARLRSRR